MRSSFTPDPLKEVDSVDWTPVEPRHRVETVVSERRVSEET